MARLSNGRLYVRMCATLLLLCLTLVVTALLSGVLLTVLFAFFYVFYIRDVPSAPLLLAVLGGVTLSILAVVTWEERRAPDHMVAALGAERVGDAEYPELLSLVRSVSQQADTPVPNVYVAPTETPLSLTTGFRPGDARLIVSDGLVATLPEAELEGVVAHELAHVKNRDTTVMTLATLPIGAADRVITLLTGRTRGVEYGQPSRASHADALMTLGVLVVPPLWVCGYVLWASLSRTREFAADRGTVAITGKPAALANALARLDADVATKPATDLRTVEVAAFAIVESNRTTPRGPVPLFGRPLVAAFPTHPPTEARIERLREIARSQLSEP